MFKALKMKIAARRMERKGSAKKSKKQVRKNSFWARVWNAICVPFRAMGRWIRAFWKWVRSIDLIGLVNITLLSAIIVLFSMLIMDIIGCNKKPVVIIAKNSTEQIANPQITVTEQSAPRAVRNRNVQRVASLPMKKDCARQFINAPINVARVTADETAIRQTARVRNVMYGDVIIDSRGAATMLKNGDIVEVLTSKSAKGPSRDWLKIAKSNEARNKIRQWFKRERREENIATGRALFESELKHAKIPLSAITAEDVLPNILRKVRFGTLDELYASIGYGGTTAVKSVARIKDELLRLGRLKAEKAAAAARTTAESVIVPGSTAQVDPLQLKGSNKHSDSGIIVEGLGNCLVKFAKCCTPVPGDPVVGFIPRGSGVSVHRADCPNADPDRRKPEEASRWVRVAWVSSPLPNYKTSLELSSKDRDGLTIDVAMALSTQKVKVNNLSARSQPDGYATIFLELSVKDRSELTGVINKLSQIQGVFLVQRANG